MITIDLRKRIERGLCTDERRAGYGWDTGEKAI